MVISLACLKWSVPCTPARGDAGRRISRTLALFTFAFLVLGMLRGASLRTERRDAQALITHGRCVATMVEVTGTPQYRGSSLRVEGRLVAVAGSQNGLTGTGTSGLYSREGMSDRRFPGRDGCPTMLASLGKAYRAGANDHIHLRPRVYVVLFQREATPGLSSDPLPVKPGDLLEVWGELRSPETARNPGEFDWREYLSRRRIYLELRGELGAARVLERHAASFLSWASRTRWTFCSCIKTTVYAHFPEESGRYLLAFMLGEEGDLGPQETNMARYLGLVRFLSLTGFHVDATMRFWYWVSRKLFRKPSLARLGVIPVGALYAFIEGFGPSVARAFICNALKCLAWELGKQYDHVSAVSISALTVATYVPSPLGDPGFAMSHAASLAAGFGPWLVPAVLIPFILTAFGELSLPGLVLGGIYAWTGGVLLILVWLGASVPLVSAVFGWIPHLVITGFIFAAETLCKIPWLRITAPAPNHLEAAGYYLGLTAFQYFRIHTRSGTGPLLRSSFPPRSRVRLAGLVLLVLSVSMLFAGSLTRVYVHGLQVVFLYAGQGDAALVRWGRRVMMVDTGTSEAFRRHVLPYLRHEGISKIDVLVLSHLHDDHAGALEDLLGWAAVEMVAVPRGRGDEVRRRLRAAGRTRRVPEVLEVLAGQTYEVDELLITVLHSGSPGASTESAARPPSLASVSPALLLPVLPPGPPLPRSTTVAPGRLPDGAFATSQDERENAESIAMFVKLRDSPGCVVEFWGDLPAEIAQKLLEAQPKAAGAETRGPGSKDIRIVKVPHHGAADSLCPGFYERLSGGYAVIPVGPNSHGHPSPAVIRTAVNADVKVFRTDVNGAVFVRLNGGKLRIDMYRQ